MLAETQTLPVPNPLMAHWAEAASLFALYVAHKLYALRIEQPKVKKERNDELDTRLNNIRQAITSSTQLIQQDVTTLSTDLRVVKSTVDGMAKNVEGLQQRELERLEADAAPTRQRRKRA